MYNPFSLEGKTILVTGASSGIGRGIAVACSKMGAKVIINGRNERNLQETFVLLEGHGHQQIIADLSSDEGLKKVVDECPVLDGIANSAGIPQMSTVKNITRISLQEIMNINSISPILLISALLKKKKIQKQASIVLIASISGICVSNIGETTYSTSKGAISGFTKGAAFELAHLGIRVNTICPGLVPTNILKLSNTIFSEDQLKESTRGKYPLKRYGTPEDIANGSIYLLSSASSWVTGINLIIDGGYTLI